MRTVTLKLYIPPHMLDEFGSANPFGRAPMENPWRRKPTPSRGRRAIHGVCRPARIRSMWCSRSIT